MWSMMMPMSSVLYLTYFHPYENPPLLPLQTQNVFNITNTNNLRFQTDQNNSFLMWKIRLNCNHRAYSDRTLALIPLVGKNQRIFPQNSQRNKRPNKILNTKENKRKTTNLITEFSRICLLSGHRTNSTALINREKRNKFLVCLEWEVRGLFYSPTSPYNVLNFRCGINSFIVPISPNKVLNFRCGITN